MKKFILSLLVLSTWLNFSFAQTNNAGFDVLLQPLSIPNLGGLQAYAFVQHSGKWLVIGGRLDGLHKRQPFASFDVAGNNNILTVVDPLALQVWTVSLNTLSVSLQEQLSSTNMEFHQEGNFLYIIGGYGYNAVSGTRKTFGSLTAIDVPNLIAAIIAGNPINSYFRQVNDAQFAVTGGHLKKINGTFYLLGGNKFDGNYNPMANPTYTQAYTNAIRKFKIADNGVSLVITHLPSIIDTVNLHRRDYNAAAQILPNGAEGISIFSGVFQPTVDLPYLNSVTVDSVSHTVVQGFQQYYNHYHCAVVPLYSANNNVMHTVFFGGISQYYDLNGVLTQDNNVPFVNTIARVSRAANGSMAEYKMPAVMPGLFGASAEFIPATTTPHYRNDVIKLDSLLSDTNLVGYIYGGIGSTGANIFFSNAANTSSASANVYKVLVLKQKQEGAQKLNKLSSTMLQLQARPNPAKGNYVIYFNLQNPGSVVLELTNANGKVIESEVLEGLAAGGHEYTVKSLHAAVPGIYLLRFKEGHLEAELKIVVSEY